MAQKSIFWLDDSPYFLEEVCKLTGKSQQEFTGILERTTFSFDYEMGKKIVRDKQFDRYIIDGTFPDALPNERRAELAKYLRHVIDNEKIAFPYGQHNAITGKGIDFYQELIPPHLKDRVVILTGSRSIAVRAWENDVPCYMKLVVQPQVMMDYVRKQTQMRPMPVDPKKLEKINWKCGGLSMFLEEILFK